MRRARAARRAFETVRDPGSAGGIIARMIGFILFYASIAAFVPVTGVTP